MQLRKTLIYVFIAWSMLGQLSQQAQAAQCTSSVYIFLDLSASLSNENQKKLAKSLSVILSASLFPEQKKIVLMPFAEKIPQFPKQLDNPSEEELRKKLESLFEPGPDVGTVQLTDIRAVFDLIDEKVQRAGPYEVFIVASDFEHDTTNSRSASALRDHIAQWREYWLEKGEGLRQRFFLPDRAALLLLAIDTKAKTIVSEAVLENLRPLAPDSGQIKPFNPDLHKGFDASSFLSYVKPVRVSVKREGSMHSGQMRVDISAYNLTCLDLKDLYYKLAIRCEGRIHTVVDRSIMTPVDGHWSASVNLPNSLFNNLQIQGKSAADIALVADVFPSSASLEGEFVGYGERKPQDYIFLEHLKGEPGLTNKELHLELTFGGELANGATKDVALEIHSRGKLVGEEEFQIDSDSFDGGGPVKLVKVMISDLPGLCISDERPVLKLRGARRDLVQYNKDLPLDVRNLHNREYRELAEGLFEQGSLPAILTLSLAFIFLFRKVYFDLGRVEELVAVIAIGATTTIVILHALTPLEYLIDRLLVDVFARWIGASSMLLLAVLIARLFQTGTLPLRVDDEEIVAELEIEEAYTRTKYSRDRTRIARFFRRFRCRHWRAIMVIFILTAGFGGATYVLLSTKEAVDCWLVFSDDLSNYRSSP